MSAPRSLRGIPLRKILRTHPVLSGLSVLAILICALFIIRLGVLVWTGGPESWATRPIEGWMTPGYLIRVYDLPQDRLAALFGAEPSSLRGKPLVEIARQTGIPLRDLIAALNDLRQP